MIINIMKKFNKQDWLDYLNGENCKQLAEPFERLSVSKVGEVIKLEYKHKLRKIIVKWEIA